MKNKKLFLDLDEEECISVGLIRLKKKLPYHEFFFRINQQNTFQFCRKKDLLIEDFSGYYNFPIFEAYNKLAQTTYRIIANKSCGSQRKEKPIEELFDLITEDKFFINENIDFIIFSKEEGGDFSLMKIPEDWLQSMEFYTLSSEQELYQTILNYDE